VIALALALCLAPLGGSGMYAGDPDSSYTVVVKYYDSIQMRYIVQHGLDDWWTGAGDVPVGGLKTAPNGTQLIDQIYCVDAKVGFHGYTGTVTSYPGGTTTDTTDGYTVAAPTTLSDAVSSNLSYLYWLTVNGFRGTLTSNNLADIRTRYAALEAQYGVPIDSTIAIMATKAAMWKFTDPTFALLSTSLNPNPANPTPTQKARYELMLALVKSMVADARAGASTLTTTKLNVEFNTTSATFTTSAGFYYYGPIQASETVQNAGAGTTPNTGLAKIFLSASGMYASDVEFVANNAGAPLPTDDKYGSDEDAPYVTNGSLFFLRVPDSQTQSLVMDSSMPPVPTSFQYLALHGYGKATDVTYNDTPMVIAYQNPGVGVQNWDTVQAFIGFAHNISASLYGEGAILLKGSSDNCGLTVNKLVVDGTELDEIGSYVFQLLVYDAALDENVPVSLMEGTNITGATVPGTVNSDGIFSLTDGQTATITGLPVGTYTVEEQQTPEGFSSAFSLNSFAEVPASSVQATLSPLNPSSTISATNTIKPKPEVPDIPKKPEVPEVPDIPEKPEVPYSPQTGDESPIIPLAITAFAALGMLVMLTRHPELVSGTSENKGKQI
jgi:hypothetical protein